MCPLTVEGSIPFGSTSKSDALCYSYVSTNPNMPA